MNEGEGAARMRDELPQTPQAQPEPQSPPMQPADSIYPVDPSQPQSPPYQPYEPAQRPSLLRESYTLYDDLEYLFFPDVSTTVSKFKFAFVAISIEVLLVVIVCVVPALFTGTLGRLTGTGGVLQPTATMMPTLPPQPTDTVKAVDQQVFSGLTLGSTRDELTRKLGAPTTGRFGDLVYPFTLPDGTKVYLGSIAEHTGSDGTPHIAGFHVDGPGDTRWSDEQCAAIARAFLPPDAKRVRHSTTSWGAQVNVYVSAALARAFPPSEFQDIFVGQVAPGTLTTACPDSAPQDWLIHTGS